MAKRAFLIVCLQLIFMTGVWAQIGSNASFDFLNLNVSARNTALGGLQTSMSLDSSRQLSDANLWLLNPAYSHERLSQQVSLSYMPFYAGVNYATLSYIQEFKKNGVWAAGIQYLNYGSFEGFDISGLPQGAFSAQDYALVINHSHQLGVYRVGANVKLAASSIAGYHAAALLMDVSGAFVHPSRDLTVTLLFSNLGVLLQDYTGAGNSRLPTDVRLGMTFKPEHMPFRFNMSAHKLLRDNQAYFQVDGREAPGLAGRALRHLTFGGEALLSPNFNVRVGYNHSLKSTLQLQQVSGGAGLTFGFMLRIRALQMDFSREFYHVAGGFSHLSLTADLKQLTIRK